MEKNELLLTLGKNLRKYREANHLTQEQLAEKVGISYPFYANLERSGKGLSVYTLKNISEVLGVSMDCLLTDNRPNECLENLIVFLRDKPDSFINAVDSVVRAIYDSSFIR